MGGEGGRLAEGIRETEREREKERERVKGSTVSPHRGWGEQVTHRSEVEQRRQEEEGEKECCSSLRS